MSKRAGRIAGLGLAGLAFVGALLWFLFDDRDSHGPLIKGKPVAYWTRHLLHGSKIAPDAISTLAAEKSVAIPALVQQLSLPDSAARGFPKNLWRRLPAMLRKWVPEPITPAEFRAASAFALDMIYRDEILLTHTRVPSLAEAEMMLPGLARALQDRDMNVRRFATRALGNLGAVSTQAIDSCEAALKDPDSSVREEAIRALGRLARSDEKAVPRLKSALTDSRPEVRKEAAEQLERLGIAPPRDEASNATESK